MYNLNQKIMTKTLRFIMLSMLMLLSGVSFGQTITFTATVDMGTQTNAGAGADEMSKEGITISVTKGALAAAQYRTAKGATMTITSTVGNITKVVFTCSASGDAQYGPGNFTDATSGNYSYEGTTGTWTGDAASFSLTASAAQVRATQIVITIGEGGGDDPQPFDGETVANIAAFKALADGTEAKLTLTNAEVLYAGTNDTYVRDASGAIDFYKAGLNLTTGNVLNGSVIGKYTLYNTTPEFVKTDNTNSNDIQQKAGNVQPKAITPADAANYVCDLVKISGATLVERTEGEYTNTYAVVGSQEVQVYDKFKVVAGKAEEGKTYDIVGIVVPFKESVEICPIEDYTDGTTPEPPTGRSYKKVTTIESGKAYLIVAEKDGALKVAKPIEKNYGYLQVADVTDENGIITQENSTNDFVITATNGGYTIKQSDNRYLYQTGSYNSFNVAAEPTEGQVWTITANADGTFKIENASVNKWVQLDSNYGTYGSYNEEKGTMPYLYVFDGEAAPVLTIQGEEEFEGSTTVTIIPSDVDHDVYYTLDGTDPKTSSTNARYMEPFTINESCTVRAWEEDADIYAEKTFTKKATQQVENIAAFKALADKSVAELKLNGAKVVYSWTSNNGNSSAYVRDASGAIVFYNTGIELQKNQDVNGSVLLQYSIYNNLPEAVKTDGTNADKLTITDGAEAEVKAIKAAQAADYVCDLVELQGVQIAEDGGKYYAVDGDDKVQIYNGFHLDAFNDLATYVTTEPTNVKGIMVVYNKTTYEIYPIEDGIVSSISNVNATAEAGDGRLYNLAGQRVGNTYKGIVIVNGKKMIK
jgi:hypothetical protein